MTAKTPRRSRFGVDLALRGIERAPLLAIENLRVVFHGDRGRRTVAVDGVDLSVARGSTLGLVGESGCGKSVTSLAVMGLLPKASAEVTGGVTLRRPRACSTCPTATLRDLRGDRMAMIFQEPMTSLNPSYTIGEQIIEVLVRHRGLTEAQARDKAIALLRARRHSRRRQSASTTIRTSSPAACASAP